VIKGAAISLGANAQVEQDTARASASNRIWKVLGCGGFFLGRWVEDIELFAKGGRHCAWYRSPADAAEQVRRYLREPGERARIADAGRAHALRHHTYARRLELLLAGEEYRLESSASDQLVVPELEDPHAGQPLDHS
jgi:spore maturation protein CgeB